MPSILRCLLSLFLLVSVVGCTTDNPRRRADDLTITLEGRIEPLQMTSWQYGSHILVNPSTGQRYALRSNTVDLDRYVDEDEVKLSGYFIDGYPVDGGPPFFQVTGVAD